MLKEKTLHEGTFRYRRYGGGEDGNSWVTYLIRGRSDLYIALLLLPKPAINDLLEYCFFPPNS